MSRRTTIGKPIVKCILSTTTLNQRSEPPQTRVCFITAIYNAEVQRSTSWPMPKQQRCSVLEWFHSKNTERFSEWKQKTCFLTLPLSSACVNDDPDQHFSTRKPFWGPSSRSCIPRVGLRGTDDLVTRQSTIWYVRMEKNWWASFTHIKWPDV